MQELSARRRALIKASKSERIGRPDEGRLLNCLEKNDARVSGRCRQALKDV